MERIKLLLKSVGSGKKGPFFFTRLPKRRLKSCNLSLSLSLLLCFPLSFLASLDLALSLSFLSLTHIVNKKNTQINNHIKVPQYVSFKLHAAEIFPLSNTKIVISHCERAVISNYFLHLIHLVYAEV